MKQIVFTTHDIKSVGTHYWGGDYEPSYRELQELTNEFNRMLEIKINETLG